MSSKILSDFSAIWQTEPERFGKISIPGPAAITASLPMLFVGLKSWRIIFDSNNPQLKKSSIKDKEIINLTKDIKNYLFSKNNDNFKLEYNNFKESLNKINNYFYKINEDNNIKDIVVDTTLTDSKNKYMNNYIYNAIVNYANYNYKKETKNITKIKENDIIQEIILKHYLNNKKQTRKDILKTYFTNTNFKQKFRNKREIENAIKSINDEMDEAQKEFSKLFISNDYTK